MKSKIKFIFAGIFFISYIGFTSFISKSVTNKSDDTQQTSKPIVVSAKSVKKSK